MSQKIKGVNLNFLLQKYRITFATYITNPIFVESHTNQFMDLRCFFLYKCSYRGWIFFWGGGGGGRIGRTPFPQRFDPCLPKGSTLCNILRHPFSVTDLKKFLKVPSAPKYTNFKGGACFRFKTLPVAHKI